MSRVALVLLVCCCDFRDGAERLMPSKSLRNAVMLAFPGLFCILRMCAPRRAAAVVRPRGHEKSADRRRRILISRLLIIRALVPRRKSLFPAYFKGFPAVSPLIPSYPAFLKYPVSPHWQPDGMEDCTALLALRMLGKRCLPGAIKHPGIIPRTPCQMSTTQRQGRQASLPLRPTAEDAHPTIAIGQVQHQCRGPPLYLRSYRPARRPAGSRPS